MEDHDVRDTRLLWLVYKELTPYRYSEILDYHNVDAAAQEQENNGS